MDSADYLRNLSSRKLPILTNNAVGAPGGDATEKALPITPPSVYNGGVPASNEKASEYNKAMALLEAGMFGLSGPNVAAVLVLALVHLADGDRRSGRRRPTGTNPSRARHRPQNTDRYESTV